MTEILRECECGVTATNKVELTLFEKDTNSKHGRRNRCKACSTKKVRGSEELVKPKGITCSSCKRLFVSTLEINKMFRRAEPTGDLVVGSLSRVCKECEAEALIKSGVELVEIDGMLIPKDINSLSKSKRISSKPIEAIKVPIGFLEKITLRGDVE